MHAVPAFDAVVFDMDGVLIDSEPLRSLSLTDVFEVIISADDVTRGEPGVRPPHGHAQPLSTSSSRVGGASVGDSTQARRQRRVPCGRR